jgi:hypothetical protein
VPVSEAGNPSVVVDEFVDARRGQPHSQWRDRFDRPNVDNEKERS